MKKNTRIFILCYPHFGMLDNWIPVIDSMQALDKSLKFTLIIPNAMICRNFDKNNAVIKISDQIFDTILIHAYDEKWIQQSSLESTIEWYQSNNIFLRLMDILKRFVEKSPIFRILILPLAILYKKVFKNEIYVDYKYIYKSILETDILLYDIHNEENNKLLNVLQMFRYNKYSLPHALSMLLDKDADSIIYKKNNIKNRNNIKLYIYAKFQNSFYKEKYGVDKNKIHVVGIPRHDKKWIKKIQKESTNLPNKFNSNKSVIILSRHVSEVHCTFDEKVRSIKNIKKIFIDKLGMRLVIKLHPSEKKERIFSSKYEAVYEDILGSDNYGKNWIYSDLHIFALGKDKKLVINLNTGVVFDIVAMGIPCIDYVDSDREELAKFTMHGDIVENASNYKELSNYVNSWIENPCKISQSSTNTYRQYFPRYDSISTIIASEILNEARG